MQDAIDATVSLETCPNRVHLDLYSEDQQSEVEHLSGLGAVKLERDCPPDSDYIVMADPDGNEFCVIASPYTQI